MEMISISINLIRNVGGLVMQYVILIRDNSLNMGGGAGHFFQISAEKFAELIHTSRMKQKTVTLF